MLTRLFRQTAVPVEYRPIFMHLYMDIGWFGILSGSALNFLNIYAARIGATVFQIGLISAMTAIVSLCLAIPAGRWLQSQHHTGRAIFWSSVIYRVGYLPLIFLPWLFDSQGQVWAIIMITFLMAIPLTGIGVGFNALFAEAVPSEYRAHVAGIRNVTFALAFVASSLISGIILDQAAFPAGYQIVFAIGFLGAAMSSLHLFFVRPLEGARPLHHFDPASSAKSSEPAPARAGRLKRIVATLGTLRLDIWRTHFRNVLLGLFAYHVAQYLAMPVFPLYNVFVLRLTDNHIGIGTALFYLMWLVGSTQLKRTVQRFGHKTVTGVGVAGMALYPFLLALSDQVWQFYFVSLLGGYIGALAGGSLANYMLEHIPPDDRPSHLAWYTIALNMAVLIGSLGGPVVANRIGLPGALLLFALLRFLSGLVILKWG
ncbi:MAG TPA: MFS transporter [Anaerolineales bacterium]|nr:MFS transporter [Anaerolineales bacterium]